MKSFAEARKIMVTTEIVVAAGSVQQAELNDFA